MCINSNEELTETIRQPNNQDFSEIHNELLFYLEDKVLNNTYSYDELVVYENYKLFNELDIDSDICRELLKEMQEIYTRGY